jgi:hypothetical protein
LPGRSRIPPCTDAVACGSISRHAVPRRRRPNPPPARR